jgi:hypothetical protein
MICILVCFYDFFGVCADCRKTWIDRSPFRRAPPLVRIPGWGITLHQGMRGVFADSPASTTFMNMIIVIIIVLAGSWGQWFLKAF